jgi:hypothetical protein
VKHRISMVIQHESFEISSRINGLSHLFANFKAECWDNNEHEHMEGIGSLLKRIANDSYRLTRLIDLSNSTDQQIEVEIADDERDPIGVAMQAVEQARNTRKVDSK